MEEQINRIGDIESSVLHSEATVLDPRFKKIGFNSITKYENAVSELRRRTTAIASVTRVASDDNVSQSCHPDDITEVNDDLWSEIDKKIKKTVPQNSTAQASIEVDRYLKEDLLPRKSDPLKWWYDRRNVYPNLYQHIMFKRLCIPATSVPCERIFSKAGDILRARRSLLKPEKVSQLLCLHGNM